MNKISVITGKIWNVVYGENPRKKGPIECDNLFNVVAEKIPFEFLGEVKKYLCQNRLVDCIQENISNCKRKTILKACFPHDVKFNKKSLRLYLDKILQKRKGRRPSLTKLINKAKKYYGAKSEGIYVAHDSMGTPRYAGRGYIFDRLGSHLQKYRHNELHYFSFYIIANKKHEKEIETFAIRIAGSSLEFNERKKWTGISSGNVNDYAHGTKYFVRQMKKGKFRHRHK